MLGNVLIVEDDRVCALIFEKILREENFDVFTSFDGKDVEDEIVKNNIDIVLLDIIMPDINGYDILQRLQSAEGFRHIPVLVVTGLTEPIEVKRALDLGALDFIRKPCESIELIARVGSALRYKKNQDSLRNLAKRDALTGLYNRWHYNKTLEDFMTVSQKSKGVALIMLDCDNFKLINDRHGHSAGDEVLEAIANVLMKSTKNGDIACRFGGEELCVILPNTTVTQACGVAERIRKNIEKVYFSYDGIRFNVTVSCGVCHINQLTDKTSRALTNAADEALYAAKANGRNRTEFYKGRAGDE